MTLKAVKETKDEIEKLTILNEFLSENPVQEAVQKVMNAAGLPQKTAYWFGKAGKKMLKLIDDMQKEYMEITKEHAEKDEKGGMKFAGPYQVKIEESKKEAYDAKVKEFGQKSVTIETMKFPMKDLEAAKLTPHELVALEWLFTDTK
jgi:hypothetical protein